MSVMFVHSWPKTQSHKPFVAVFEHVQIQSKWVFDYVTVIEICFHYVLYSRNKKSSWFLLVNLFWRRQKSNEKFMDNFSGITWHNLHWLPRKGKSDHRTVMWLYYVILWSVKWRSEEENNSLTPQQCTSSYFSNFHEQNYLLSLYTAPSSTLFFRFRPFPIFLFLQTWWNGSVQKYFHWTRR